MTGGQCLLGHHFGDKNSIIDTAKINTSGWMEFKNKEAVPGGIYFIVLPSKNILKLFLLMTKTFRLKQIQLISFAKLKFLVAMRINFSMNI